MSDDILNCIRSAMEGRSFNPRTSSFACLDEWKEAVRIWASGKVSRERVKKHAATLSTELDLKRPSDASLRDWIIREKKSIGMLRPYRRGGDRTEVPIIGGPKKPTIFLIVNSKGGSRRSHTASLVYRALVESGVPSPIAATLLPNDSSHLFPPGVSVQRFVLNHVNEEEGWNSNLLNFWFGSLNSGENLASSMVVDMPCRFDWEPIIQLVSDYYYPYEGDFDVVGVVPTLPDPANLRGAIEVIERFQFKKWIHFSYDHAHESEELFEKVRSHSPSAVVSPPEISLREAIATRSVPLMWPSSHVEAGATMRKRPSASYWERVRASIISALDAVFC